MKKIIGGTILTLASLSAYADNSSYCYSISDSTQKNYCLAQAKKQKTYCYNISDSNTKNMCLAQASGQKTYCYNISNQNTKNQCLAQTR
jgi:hypothetical protein